MVQELKTMLSAVVLSVEEFLILCMHVKTHQREKYFIYFNFNSYWFVV